MYDIPENIDISALTYKDINPEGNHYIQIPAGREMSRNGRYKVVYRGLNCHKVPALGGMINEEAWTRVAKEVIKINGDEALFQAIITHVSAYHWWNNDPIWKIEHYAAQCLVNEAYKAWAERGEFTIPEKGEPYD